MGAVIVQELPPAAGLAITSMSGSGWSCSLINFSCSRNDPLNPTAQYPPITVLANVSSNAAASLTNTAAVQSAIDSDRNNNTSADLTIIVQSALNVTVAPGVVAFNRPTGRYRHH